MFVFWNFRFNYVRTLTFIRMRYILAIITFVLFNPITFSQEVYLKARLDSSHILIGDQVNLSMEITQPNGLHLDLPELFDTLTGKIEILEKTNIDTTFLENNQILLKQNFLITCYDSGFYKIPPFQVRYQEQILPQVTPVRPFSISRCHTGPRLVSGKWLRLFSEG